jgi:hypothetical protein
VGLSWSDASDDGCPAELLAFRLSSESRLAYPWGTLTAGRTSAAPHAVVWENGQWKSEWRTNCNFDLGGRDSLSVHGRWRTARAGTWSGDKQPIAIRIIKVHKGSARNVTAGPHRGTRRD